MSGSAFSVSSGPARVTKASKHAAVRLTEAMLRPADCLNPLCAVKDLMVLTSTLLSRQPRQARMAGSGEKADRRPIDPPPIIRLRTRKAHARKKPEHLLTDNDLVTPTLTHTLFMFASLVPENSEEELFEAHGSKSALVAGSVVSSLFHLKDSSCFVFPDMSIRVEGRWRFKMSLYEVHECASIIYSLTETMLMTLSAGTASSSAQPS